MEEQELQIQLSLINQGEWKIASEYKEYQTSEDKFYQMNKDQRLKFITNNTEVKKPEYDESIGNKNYTNTDTNKITITVELSGNMYLPLAVHCVKSVQIRSFFWSEYRKIRTRRNSVLRTRRNSVFGHFSLSGSGTNIQ